MSFLFYLLLFFASDLQKIRSGDTSGILITRYIEEVYMKTFLILITLSYSSLSLGANGMDLINALRASIDEARAELNLDNIEAFKASSKSEHDVLVAMKDNLDIHRFGCHYHGQQMACHLEEGDHHLLEEKSGEGKFERLFEGHEAALNKLEKTLARNGDNLSILTSIKTWKITGPDDGHGHGDDIWTKVTYNQNEKAMIVFVQCHKHHGANELACHYKRSGNGEPIL